jgi:cell division protein FtsZ
MDDIMNFDIQIPKSSIIKVIGVGGGGSNAVNYMYEQGIKDVDFIVCNTDAQALLKSPVPIKIQLGATLTEGLGAGNKPEQGKQAAIENLSDIEKFLDDGTKMVFITAGMGGGTGTGAAPIIASTAKEKNILTVGIVTIPFKFEGKRRITQAIEGIKELKQHVDSLLVINNEKLRDLHSDLGIGEAFAKADNILSIAAKGIAEIITVHGHVNVDFADVKTVMTDSGVAIMGTGKAEGENRAVIAVKQALESPLLNSNNIKGAKNVLLNITSGSVDATMNEVGEISDYVQEEAGMSADLITGISYDQSLGENIAVTVIATGFSTSTIIELNEIINSEKIISTINNSGESERFSKTVELEPKISQNTEHTDHVQKEIFNFNTTNLTPSVNKTFDKQQDLSKVRNAHLVDELENIPAYKRKQQAEQRAENSIQNEENFISKFSLSEDENGKIKIRENNSYLHDNVD